MDARGGSRVSRLVELGSFWAVRVYANFAAHNINIAQRTVCASLAVNSITAGVNFKF